MRDRYIRNIKAISIEENTSLFAKKVCVGGCGGLGGYIIEIMARIGVGELVVIDGDVFEESNLNRQLLSTVSTLGKSKAEAAAERVAQINPDVKVKVVKEFITENSCREILLGCDVAADAFDNIRSKKVLEKSCEESGIPMVHGAIGGWYGQVTTLFPGDRTLDFLYKNIENNEDSGIEKILGNLPFTAAYIASVQSSEIIKILTGRGELLRKKIWFVDLLNNETEVVEV